VIKIIPPGRYSQTDLSTAVDTLIKTANATYTCTFNTVSASLVWNIGTSVLDGSSAKFVLGIADSNPTGSFSSIPDLTGPSVLCFYSDELNRSEQVISSNGSFDSPLFVVPLFAGYLSQNYFDNRYKKNVSVHPGGFKRINFHVRDEKGQELEGPPSEFVLSFEIQ
jgi:hypothetical protein